MNITLTEMQTLAARFERRIYWRNVREYAAGVIGILFFAARLWSARGWQLVLPLLLIAGTFYVLVQLHRRAPSRSLSADAGLWASLDFYIHELERQRAALRQVWSWYLLPLVPGFAASIAAAAASRPAKPGFIILFSVALAVLYFAIWRLNASAAAKLDRTIDELRGSSE